MEEIKNRKRVSYIDFLRGTGIALVVLGHFDIPNKLLMLIYAVHMPLFFFLSGLVYKDSDNALAVRLKKNAQNLLYPYFMLGTIIVFYNTIRDLVLSEMFSASKLIKRIIALLYGNMIWENNYEYIGTLWFLVALFSVEMIWEIVHRLSKKKIKYEILFVFFIVSIELLLKNIVLNGVRLPFCVDVAIIALPFFVLGKYMPTCENIKTWKCTVAIFISGVIGVILAFINSLSLDQNQNAIMRTDMLRECFGNIFLFYASAILLIFCFYFISKIIYSKVALPIIEEFGRLSLLIMVIHLYLKLNFEVLFGKLHIGLNWVVFSILVFVLSYLLAKVVDRYFRFLLDLRLVLGLIR